MSKKAIDAKKDLVHAVTEELKSAKSFVIFEYLGLKAKDMTNLRFELQKCNSRLHVLKNNILNRAIKEANISGFEDLISGPNAIAIAFEDEINPIKAVNNVAKEFDVIKFKGAYLENTFINEQKFKQLATIPGRDGLYSMFLSCLQSPIRSFLYALKAVSETKN